MLEVKTADIHICCLCGSIPLLFYDGNFYCVSCFVSEYPAASRDIYIQLMEDLREVSS